eukprot:CAMPEP_0113308662 /NCGR_PEP_ID=MMETSP0010_2-20120614/7019_1 /TAXON_ID=216773 ORGANISM="Corethron hystrix, Strain 308" /NCGR_SAMPLE_ID=MMETSP0010_2 /ASSEMBLY_ACC=CAM_ASM_000155 /LENGTH=253 /DNA_ID=CAMNT_0000163765 /DNA_START=136 /DNA_END=897 /DNA_ORIENTATION=- /assembly_acc=CAM_ASM_000155
MRRTALLAPLHASRWRKVVTDTVTPILCRIQVTTNPFVRSCGPFEVFDMPRKFSSKADNEGSSSPDESGSSSAEIGEEAAAVGEVTDKAKPLTDSQRILKLEDEVRRTKEQYIRSLAEQENTRRIAKRDVESARQYAVSSFAKSLLTSSDNLERAMAAVPEDLQKDKEKHPVLAALYEGIELTEAELMKAFKKNGLEKFGAVGDVFDPNIHEAMYEYSDPTKDAGTVGQVMEKGFSLHGRVIRPAEVGVVKKV